MAEIASAPTLVTVEQKVLISKGFTDSGRKQFCATVSDYSLDLFKRSVRNGIVDKASTMAAEITHEHVKKSAHAMASRFGARAQSNWYVVAHIGEYVGTACAGVGGGHLESSWGIVTFGVALSVAVVLMVLRLSRKPD
jgi:hypothetical protein